MVVIIIIRDVIVTLQSVLSTLPLSYRLLHYHPRLCSLSLRRCRHRRLSLRRCRLRCRPRRLSLSHCLSLRLCRLIFSRCRLSLRQCRLSLRRFRLSYRNTSIFLSASTLI